MIRWARPHEGLLVRSLLKSNRLLVADELDWTQPLGPFWLLAIQEQPIGCLMVNPGTPVGRMDLMAVRRDVSHRVRAQAVHDLCYAGAAVLRTNGSQMVMSGCALDNPKWKQVLQKRKFVFTETIEIGLKRL